MMIKKVIFTVLLIGFYVVYAIHSSSTSERPTVMVAILVRNKAFILPWFLGHLERLNYPKLNIELWIRSDHNIDNSSAILHQWVTAVRKDYRDIDLYINDTVTEYDGEQGPAYWSTERMSKVIALRQEALETARRKHIDYLFMLDADIVLENEDTLNLLVDANRYKKEQGYYKSSELYYDVIWGKRLGVFACPLVHSAILINTKCHVSRKLFYSPSADYEGPNDDMIIFALSAREAGKKSKGMEGISNQTRLYCELLCRKGQQVVVCESRSMIGEGMYIDNRNYYGRIILPNDDQVLHMEQFGDVKIKAAAYREPLRPSSHVNHSEPPVEDRMGFDQIYLVNLKRRPERKRRSENILKLIGLKAHFIEAVDGRELNGTILKKMGIRLLPEYKDFFSGRRLNMGAVGCFLSHYYIWKDVIKKSFQRVLILEDDFIVKSTFKRNTLLLIEEAEQNVPEWDFIYLGRFNMTEENEDRILGTTRLVWPKHSLLTVGYSITYNGAMKLVNGKPLGKLIPVDDYITIMNDQYNSDSIKRWYYPRNLRSLAADPDLVSQTLRWFHEGYSSDTKDSSSVPTESNIEGTVENYCINPSSCTSP